MGKEDPVRANTTQKSIGLNRVRQQVQREWAEVTAKLFFIIWERSWKTGDVPEDCRKVNNTLVFRKGKEKDLRNFRPLSHTSAPVKVIEQLFQMSSPSKWKRTWSLEVINTNLWRGNHA